MRSSGNNGGKDDDVIDNGNDNFEGDNIRDEGNDNNTKNNNHVVPALWAALQAQKKKKDNSRTLRDLGYAH